MMRRSAVGHSLPAWRLHTDAKGVPRLTERFDADFKAEHPFGTGSTREVREMRISRIGGVPC